MKCLSLVLVGVGCMLFQGAQATLLFSDAFNYNAGALGGNNNPGGNAWQGGATGLSIVSGNLTYTGLPDQGGNELQIANGAAGTSYITFANQTSGQIYYSFLFNASVVDSANTYFTAMNPGTTAPAGGADAIDAYYYSSGKMEIRGNAQSAQAGTGTALTLGTTYLIVEEIDLTAKTASLWINPSSSSFGGTAPTATANLSSLTATAIDNVGFNPKPARALFWLTTFLSARLGRMSPPQFPLPNPPHAHWLGWACLVWFSRAGCVSKVWLLFSLQALGILRRLFGFQSDPTGRRAVLPSPGK